MMQLPTAVRGRHFAHRGLHAPGSARPENSQAAFQAAIAAGYGIELDVRLGAEGEPLVFHDGDLARMTGFAGRIEECAPGTRATLRLLGTGETIPSLAQTLELVAGRCPVLVEIKADPPGLAAGPPDGTRILTDRVVTQVRRHAGVAGIMSYGREVMRQIRAQAPELWRGATCKADEALAEGAVEPPPGGFVAWEASGLPNPDAKAARERGVQVFSWTVTDAAEAERLRPCVDALIFEHFLPPKW